MLSEKTVLEALRTVQDPDFGKDIVTLKQVKDLRIDGGRVSFTVEQALFGSHWRQQVGESAGAAAVARETEGDPMTAGVTAVLFVVFATALALGGWASVWAGRAIRQYRSPGRTGALLLAVINLFMLPFGTALAIYTFWVLLHNDARALFVPDAPGTH